MASQLILQNFILVCIALVMIALSIQNMRSRRFTSIIVLIIVVSTLLLSFIVAMENYGISTKNTVMATVFCFLGYVIRPVVLYSFILLARRQFGYYERLGIIPLVLIALVYSTSLFLNAPDWFYGFAFHYEIIGDKLTHVRGPMNFTAHIIGFLYLLALLAISIRKLRGRHRHDAISVLICAAFTVAAVLLEMFSLGMGVLNMTIMASVVFYYLFVLTEENRRDALTGLFDRKTYYRDSERFSSAVTGVVQIDMNGLKALNDSQGHEAGDKALLCIGSILEEKAPRKMYIYRIGGDEFTALAVSEGKEEIEAAIASIRKEIESRGYSISIGFSYREDKNTTVEELAKSADQAMYADKANYYKDHPALERRASRR